jgi:MFS family permease
MATIAAYVTFAVGFIARPFGGLFFGHFGDRLGRKPMLVATIILVGGGTFLIGCLPTYAAIGIWAPLLLLLMRLMQGFGAGAEYGGAVILAVEFAPAGKRGLYGSFAPLGVTAGNLMAAGVFYLVTMMSKDDLLAWGWRIPFLVSMVLLLVGVYIRMKVSETPVFTDANARRPRFRAPAIEALRRHPRNFIVVIGARLAENGLGYLFPVFGLSYIINTLHMSREVAITGVILGNFAEMIFIVLASWLSDKIGRRPVYMGGAIFSALFAFPFFLMVGTRNPVMISLAFILIMGIGGGGMFGPQASFFAELFGPRLRYSGFAFARELGSILAGGPSPLIAALLVGWMAGAPWGVACYVILLSALTALAVWWGPETTHSDIRAEHPEDQEAPEPALSS